MYTASASSMTTTPRARGGGLARRLLLAVLALVAVLPIAALGAQSASASVYTQHACTTRAGTDHFSFTSSGSYFRQLNTCSSGGVLGGAFFSTVAHVNGDHATWSYAAPSATTVVRLAGSYAKAAGPHRDYGDAGAFLTASNGRALDSCSTFRGCKGGYGTNTWDLSASPATSFRFGAMCGGRAGCPAGLTEYALSNIAIGLDDNTNPDVTGPVSGPLMNDSVLHGAPAVSLVAHDTGGGLRSVQLLTDGHLVSETPIDLNGGACKDYDPNNNNPYEYAQAVPCKLAASGSFNLDTTPLSDGSHRLDVQISDAAGNTSVIGTRTAVVDNHPPVVSATLAGQAKVGQTLTCNPTITEGQNPTVTYEWIRRRPTGDIVIPGAVSKTYVASPADVQYFIKCRVTAIDLGGSAAALSAAVGPVVAGDGSQGHHPPDNGNGATDKATISARWTRVGKGKGTTRGVSVYGGQPTIQGVVKNDKGQPISNATLDVVVRQPTGEQIVLVHRVQDPDRRLEPARVVAGHPVVHAASVAEPPEQRAIVDTLHPGIKPARSMSRPPAW